MSLNWAEIDNCFNLPLGNGENKYPIYNTPNISIFKGMNSDNFTVQNSKNEINRNWSQRMDVTNSIQPSNNELIPSSFIQNNPIVSQDVVSNNGLSNEIVNINNRDSYSNPIKMNNNCINCDSNIENFITRDLDTGNNFEVPPDPPYTIQNKLSNSLVKIPKNRNKVKGVFRSKLNNYPLKRNQHSKKKDDVEWVVILYLFVFIFTYMSFKTN